MRRLVAALLVAVALGAGAPSAGAAAKVPWRQCGSLTVASGRLAVSSWAVQRMDCLLGLELVLRARRLSGGQEGTLRIDKFRCRVESRRGRHLVLVRQRQARGAGAAGGVLRGRYRDPKCAFSASNPPWNTPCSTNSISPASSSGVASNSALHSMYVRLPSVIGSRRSVAL